MLHQSNGISHERPVEHHIQRLPRNRVSLICMAPLERQNCTRVDSGTDSPVLSSTPCNGVALKTMEGFQSADEAT